jgi:hypothetical protein
MSQAPQATSKAADAEIGRHHHCDHHGAAARVGSKAMAATPWAQWDLCG